MNTQRTIFDDLQTSKEDHMIEFIVSELKGRFHMYSKTKISIKTIESMHIVCRYIEHCIQTLSKDMYGPESMKFEKQCFDAIRAAMKEITIRDIIKYHVVEFFERYNY